MQGSDLRGLDARRRFDFEQGNDRAGVDGDHLCLDAEVEQLLFQQARHAFQRLFRKLHGLGLLGQIEQR